MIRPIEPVGDQQCDTVPVFLGLGSNLGDSRRIFSEVVAELAPISPTSIQVSSMWETTPVDCPPGSPKFLNAVVRLNLPQSTNPYQFLQRLQALERKHGRVPKRELNEARPLDLDLICFGSLRVKSEELELPHPRAHERRFVLEPLCELAPWLVLPGQSLSISELLAKLAPDPGMRRVS